MDKKFESVKTLLTKQNLKKFTAAYGANSRAELDDLLNCVQMLKGHMKLVPMMGLMRVGSSLMRSFPQSPVHMIPRADGETVLGDIINMTDLPSGSSVGAIASTIHALRRKMRIYDDFVCIEDYAVRDAATDEILYLDEIGVEAEALVMSDSSIQNGVNWLKENTNLVKSNDDCVLIGIESLGMAGWGGNHWKALASIGLPVVGGMLPYDTVNESRQYRAAVVNAKGAPAVYSTVDPLPFITTTSMDNQLRCSGLFAYTNHWNTSTFGETMIFFVAPKALYDIGDGSDFAADDELITAISEVPSIGKVSGGISDCTDAVMSDVYDTYTEQNKTVCGEIDNEIRHLKAKIRALEGVKHSIHQTTDFTIQSMEDMLRVTAKSVLDEYVNNPDNAKALEAKMALASLRQLSDTSGNVENCMHIAKLMKGELE